MTAWSNGVALALLNVASIEFPFPSLGSGIIISFVHSSSLSKGAELECLSHVFQQPVHLVADVGADVVVTTVVLAVDLGLGLGTYG
jgi:hypothetical protein